MEPVNKLSNKMEEWSHDQLLSVLQRWEMKEFYEFVKEKQLDGKDLSDVTEGILKVWKPKVDVKKIVHFLNDLKEHPDKYLSTLPSSKKEIIKVSKETNICPESQYQTVTVRKTREEVNVNTVEDILKKIVPAKSFLYRNQQKRTEKAVTSYLPMDTGTAKKRSFFRLSSYEYPFFDLRLRFPKIETSTDRGYYSVKSNRYCIPKSCKKQEVKTKYKCLPSPEPTCPQSDVIEDHLYEDLNYNEMNNINDTKDTPATGQNVQVKPCMVKIQELFQSFKFPFFNRSEDVPPCNKMSKEEKEINIYENNDGVLNMYDSIHVMNDDAKAESKEEKHTLPVEEYLEPVQLQQEYCDVRRRHEDSLLGYIMNYFENRFGMRRDSRIKPLGTPIERGIANVVITMCWWIKVSVPLLHNLVSRVAELAVDIFYRLFHCLTDVVAETNDGTHSEDSETDSKDIEDKWSTKKTCNMAARPLPVPVENEPFYMNVDRAEAENLLKGQPDGTFVLRPSSQPNHAYTLSVSCGGEVHNVGVRRRSDGRLALGFARRGERSFPTVTSLLRHHRRRRLLLVAAGDVIGATTLTDTPHYYQTPSSLPVLHV